MGVNKHSCTWGVSGWQCLYQHIVRSGWTSQTGLFDCRFLRGILPQTVVVYICRACAQMYSGIIISFGCHSEFFDPQKSFCGALLLRSFGSMLYEYTGWSSAHCWHSRLYLVRLLLDLAPACCSSSPSFLFKWITSWVSFPVCCCGTPSDVETGPSLFSSMICWIYESSCAKTVQTNCLPAG